MLDCTGAALPAIGNAIPAAVRSRGHGRDCGDARGRAPSRGSLPPRVTMPLVLVAPGLLSSPAGAFDRDRAFAMLAGHADAVRIHPDGDRRGDARGVAMPERHAGRAARRARRRCRPWRRFRDRRRSGALRCRPRRRRADAARRRPASATKPTRWSRRSTAHFADDGLRFVAPRAGAWFVLAAQAPADRDDARSMPSSGAACSRTCRRAPDAGTWKRWQDEIGMLLHDHPVNAAREARGRAERQRRLVLGWRAARATRAIAVARRRCRRARRRRRARHRARRPWQRGALAAAAGWLDRSLRQRCAGANGSANAAATIVVTDTDRQRRRASQRSRATGSHRRSRCSNGTHRRAARSSPTATASRRRGPRAPVARACARGCAARRSARHDCRRHSRAAPRRA